MSELLDHILQIEMQKTELKLNDYEEYLQRVDEKDREVLKRIVDMLDEYLHELEKLKG